MTTRRRCACGEPIAKSAREEGGVVLLGTAVLFADHLAVTCPKCKQIHRIAVAATHRPRPIILPHKP